MQFVLHAALDAVDEQQWSTPNMHLGVVDRFHNLQVCILSPLKLPVMLSYCPSTFPHNQKTQHKGFTYDIGQSCCLSLCSLKPTSPRQGVLDFPRLHMQILSRCLPVFLVLHEEIYYVLLTCREGPLQSPLRALQH